MLVEKWCFRKSKDLLGVCGDFSATVKLPIQGGGQHLQMSGSYPQVWGGGGGFKWSGCKVRIRRWLRLPHTCHRLLSIVSTSGASLGVLQLCIFLALLPR